MSKYISVKGLSRCNRWHEDPECSRMKLDSRELTQPEEAYHDLEPCGTCVEGVETPSQNKQDWTYQEVIDQ